MTWQTDLKTIVRTLIGRSKDTAQCIDNLNRQADRNERRIEALEARLENAEVLLVWAKDTIEFLARGIKNEGRRASDADSDSTAKQVEGQNVSREDGVVAQHKP